jgi:mRNA-degrading endonuclease RelE of RelBE toxin-antitoxin system
LNHRASPDFWECYRRLPKEIRDVADKAFAFLKQDERHPSLHLKKVGRFWSARVGSRYRALAVESDDTLIWFWIGTHAEYDGLVG